jgi:hypothetical protein
LNDVIQQDPFPRYISFSLELREQYMEVFSAGVACAKERGGYQSQNVESFYNSHGRQQSFGLIISMRWPLLLFAANIHNASLSDAAHSLFSLLSISTCKTFLDAF